MALEALCGLPVRGKMVRGGPFELGDSGFDIKKQFTEFNKDPECLVSPPFVSPIPVFSGVNFVNRVFGVVKIYE